jgi:hypothetical protein
MAVLRLAESIRRIDLQTWSYLLPTASPAVRQEIADEFARWVAGRRPSGWSWTCWQDAWNEWAGVRGSVRYLPRLCPECCGQIVSHRALARTGQWVCTTCHGTRRAPSEVLRACRAPPSGENTGGFCGTHADIAADTALTVWSPRGCPSLR